ncbi:MAG: primosomal protein N', partial [Kiritimatiellae bacterium]|nr:primosomal protein N' [Kiritimatiellia bacterium]
MIAKIAIDLSLDRLFEYSVPAAMEGKLAVGQLLSVPFGHRQARGFVVELDGGEGESPGGGSRGYSLKPISAIVDETPFFSAKLIVLARSIADYFAAPIESVLRAAVPAAVTRPGAREKRQFFVEAANAESREGLELTARQKWIVDQIVRLGGGWMAQLCDEISTTPATLRTLAGKGAVTVEERQRRRIAIDLSRVLPTKPLALNGEQAKALETIETSFKPVLLKGITGAGKTEVYLQAIARALEKGGGAIVMVPEIALTPQTVQRFAARLGDKVAVLHSALSDGERYDEWHRIRSGKARVVVGPRSAVFAPVKDLALIVVDEEHETSYKQEDNPRYNARDAAVMRAAIEGARVVLGSATPSLESWENVRKGKYVLSEIKHRAGMGTVPNVSVVDMSEQGGGGAIYSGRLLEAIRERLARHEQVILFINRRGYSRS